MKMEPGTELLHYRLLEKLGEGGMGVVWKALDTTLDREVAIKVLPAAVAQDAERLSRFEREAKLLAALNHSNIATAHGLHDANGVRFLAMEYVDGENLAERLERGPLPTDEAVAIACQVAEALEAAHELGIIHRDLKPANIQVAKDGRIKVLDFGLAKALSPGASGSSDLSQSPTLTSAGTVAGVLLGTAAYMSPEQARAKSVDRRADVWAFGCVLYEMLTGRKAFGGETLSDTLATILKENPDWSALRSAESRALQPLMERCLRKDPKRRPHHLADVRISLEEAAETPTDAGPSIAMPRWGQLTIAVLALIVVALSYLWLAGPGRQDSTGGAVRLKMSHQTYYAGVETAPSLSPDGSFLAYSAAPDGGSADIFIERVGGSNPINLTADSEAWNNMPAFSPDGKSIAFRSNRGDGGGIFVMGATGESVRRVADQGFNPAWSPDGKQLLFVEEGTFSPMGRNRLSPLWIVDVATGEKRKLYEADCTQPSWSPNAHRIACWTAGSGTKLAGQRDIFSIRADGTDRVDVTSDIDLDWNPVWSPDGRHLYFASDRGGSMNIWRVPIDERTGRPLGEPQPVPTPSQWSGPFALSRTGLIAFVAEQRQSNVSRVPFDASSLSITGPPEKVTSGTLLVYSDRVSPDGKWMVFQSGGVREDIYLVRTDGTGMRKLTDDRYLDRGPSWTPDGERIAFYSNRGGRYEIWTMRRDGSELVQLTETEGSSLWYPKISPDGRLMSASNMEGTWLFELTGAELLSKHQGIKLPPVGDSDGVFFADEWSPDGSYLAGSTRGELPPVLYDVELERYRILHGQEEGRLYFAGWLPDGRAIVNDRTRTWVVDIDAASWTLVQTPSEDMRGLTPSPDGRWLYFTTYSSEADIWIAEIE